MDGYFKIVTPTVAGVTPMDIERFPDQKELFFRGTLTWDPSDRVAVRLKATFTDTDMLGGSSQFSDIVACPYGTPQRPGETAFNCLNDGKLLISQIPASSMQMSQLSRKSERQPQQQPVAAERPDRLGRDRYGQTDLVTGYYKVTEKLTSNGGYGPYSNNAFGVRFSTDRFTQELRLASSFDGPVNFLAGGFYEDRKLYTLTMIGSPTAPRCPPAHRAHPGQRPPADRNRRTRSKRAIRLSAS
jgi:iron complex outermembrane receptor protein